MNATIQSTCSHCKYQMHLRSSMVGKQGKCPSCNAVITVTASPQPASETRKSRWKLICFTHIFTAALTIGLMPYWEPHLEPFFPAEYLAQNSSEATSPEPDLAAADMAGPLEDLGTMLEPSDDLDSPDGGDFEEPDDEGDSSEQRPSEAERVAPPDANKSGPPKYIKTPVYIEVEKRLRQAVLSGEITDRQFGVAMDRAKELMKVEGETREDFYGRLSEEGRSLLDENYVYVAERGRRDPFSPEDIAVGVGAENKSGRPKYIKTPQYIEWEKRLFQAVVEGELTGKQAEQLRRRAQAKLKLE